MKIKRLIYAIAFSFFLLGCLLSFLALTDIETSTTVGQVGGIKPILSIDTPILATTEILGGHAIYLGGYPNPDQVVTSKNIYIAWLPSGEMYLFWFIY